MAPQLPQSPPTPLAIPNPPPSDQIIVTTSIQITTSPCASQASVEALVRATNRAVKQRSNSHWGPNAHQLRIMATLSLISLMVALDSCVIVTSLNAIIVDLELSTSDGIWIGTAYLLANAVTMPLVSELSNIFGRPVVLACSLCSFAVGTLLCCLARGLAQLLAGRVVQGIGGSGIIVLSLVIFTDMVPLRWRPRWYGFVLGAWAVGNCTGPIIGGVIVQKTTWRWVFYMMFPLCAIGLAMVLYLLKYRAPSATALQKLRRIDWLGGIYFIASTTIFLVAISWGGLQFSWASAGTLVPLCLGAVGMFGMVLYEIEFAPHPFLRRRLFRNLSSVITYSCGTVQGLMIYGQLYFIPLYFQSVKGYSPLYTGLATLPVMVTCVPSSIVTGTIVTKTGNYQWPIWVGWAILLLGSGLTILFGRDTATGLWVVILIIVGFGHGAVLNAQNFASQAMCAPGDEGSAAAMYAFVRQFGMALGVGFGSSIFQNTMASNLRSQGLDSAIASWSELFIKELWELPVGDLDRSLFLDAYVFGLRSTYLFFSCTAAIALVLSLFSKQYVMREEINREDVFERILFELT